MEGKMRLVIRPNESNSQGIFLLFLTNYYVLYSSSSILAPSQLKRAILVFCACRKLPSFNSQTKCSFITLSFLSIERQNIQSQFGFITENKVSNYSINNLTSQLNSFSYTHHSQLTFNDGKIPPRRSRK
jgi:hypothetical protein